MPHPSAQTAPITLVSTYLDAFFTRKIAAARDVHPRYEALWGEIARVSSHGKRLRPLMTLLAYESFGGTEISRVVPAAAACELLHVSMLIHDDIIDRDMLRHGELTIQASYEQRYAAEVPQTGERSHNAMAAAILAGDLLLSEARGLMTKVEVSEDSARQAGFAFDQAVFEVAGGELLDIESASAPRGSVDSLTIMVYKTASYSFVGPLLIGAILAEASLAEQKILRSFAVNLGIAYQLTDDILGIFGNTSTTGKPTVGDIHEGKSTYLVERFYAMADAESITEFEKYYGKRDATNAECERIRAVLESSGALAETERSVRHYSAAARANLRDLILAPADTAAFAELIAKCTDRSA